jgi:hypothetical protein
MIAVKIECGCSQRYSFDVEPINRVMPWPVQCPVCGVDGTASANVALADYLAQQPASVPADSMIPRAAPINRSIANTMGKPLANPRGSRNLNSRWAGKVTLVSAVLLLCLASFGYVQYSRGHGAKSPVLLHAEGHEFPRTLAELNASYAEPPPGQNAATIYLQAFETLQIGKGSKVPLLGKGTLPNPRDPLPFAEKSAMTSLLKANRQALLLLAQGASYEQSRYPVDFSRGIDATSPHLPKLRTSALLLELSAVLHAEAHQGKAAANDVLALLGLGRSLVREPSLLSQSVRAACVSAALAAWEQTLNRTDVPSESLAEVSQAFTKLESCEVRGESFARGFAAERCNWLVLLDDPHKLLEILSLPSVKIPADEREQLFARLLQGGELKVEKTQLEQAYTQLMDARHQSFPAKLKADELVQERLTEATAAKLTVFGVILTSFAGQTGKEAELLAKLRLGMVCAALEQFRFAHGSYPDELSNLVPDYLPRAVLNPYDGKPFGYRKDETGVVLSGTRSHGREPIEFRFRKRAPQSS